MVRADDDRHRGLRLLLVGWAGPGAVTKRMYVGVCLRDFNPYGRDLRLCLPRRIAGGIVAGQKLADVSEVRFAPYVHGPVVLTTEFALDGGAR